MQALRQEQYTRQQSSCNDISNNKNSSNSNTRNNVKCNSSECSDLYQGWQLIRSVVGAESWIQRMEICYRAEDLLNELQRVIDTSPCQCYCFYLYQDRMVCKCIVSACNLEHFHASGPNQFAACKSWRHVSNESNGSQKQWLSANKFATC